MTPNISFTSLMPDSILANHKDRFPGEVAAFPPALASLSGLQAAAAGWMNLRGHSPWGKHQCWWLTQELERGKGIQVPALNTLWDALLHKQRADAVSNLIQQFSDSRESHPNIYHATNLHEHDSESLHRMLEIDHLSAFHVDYYNSNLVMIAKLIKETMTQIAEITAESMWRVNLRHPMVTANQHHPELLAQDGDNLIRLLYKLPILTSKGYQHLWETLGVREFGTIPHLNLFPFDAFHNESNEVHQVYHSWMRFNAYATVTGPGSDVCGAVHADTIHPVLLHGTTEIVSAPMVELPRLGIHDKAVIYRTLHKKGAANAPAPAIPDDLIRLTHLASVLCQLLTAFSNGKKGTRGQPKARWSSSPANITWGKMLLAVTPSLISEI